MSVCIWELVTKSKERAKDVLLWCSLEENDGNPYHLVSMERLFWRVTSEYVTMNNFIGISSLYFIEVWIEPVVLWTLFIYWYYQSLSLIPESLWNLTIPLSRRVIVWLLHLHEWRLPRRMPSSDFCLSLIFEILYMALRNISAFSWFHWTKW